jgi:hypothetical protein
MRWAVPCKWAHVACNSGTSWKWWRQLSCGSLEECMACPMAGWSAWSLDRMTGRVSLAVHAAGWMGDSLELASLHVALRQWPMLAGAIV